MLPASLNFRRDSVRGKVAEYKVLPSTQLLDSIEDSRFQLRQQIEDWFAWHNELVGSIRESLGAIFPAPAWPAREPCLPELEILHVPSSYPPAMLEHRTFKRLRDAELDLRRAQANDILKDLRTKLGVQSYIWKETRHDVGQIGRTRSTAAIERARKNVASLQQQYTQVLAKLRALGEPLDSHNYRDLPISECVPLQVWHTKEKPGQKKIRLSWIWRDGSFQQDGDLVQKWETERKLASPTPTCCATY